MPGLHSSTQSFAHSSPRSSPRDSARNLSPLLPDIYGVPSLDKTSLRLDPDMSLMEGRRPHNPWPLGYAPLLQINSPDKKSVIHHFSRGNSSAIWKSGDTTNLCSRPIQRNGQSSCHQRPCTPFPQDSNPLHRVGLHDRQRIHPDEGETSELAAVGAAVLDPPNTGDC